MNAQISIASSSLLRRIPIYVALVVASFTLYFYTLAPGVLDSDGGEFQFAAWNFSFVHPTGYPLFLLVGGIFQHLFPGGSPAFRLNLFNAIIAACAVGTVYLAVAEITRQRIGAVIGAASFAVSHTFWFDASGVEVHALNSFFLALLIYLAARWTNRPHSRTFVFICLAYGLALAHHRAIVLWLPAFALWLLLASLKILKSSVRIRIPLSRGLLCAACFLLPLLLYAYVPLRAPASPYFRLPLSANQSLLLYDNTAQGFFNYALGRTFAFELKWDGLSVARWLATPQLLLTEFGVLGAILGTLGLGAFIWRRNWTFLAFSAMGVGLTLFFNSIYHIGDIGDYYIPVYLIWAVLIANSEGLMQVSKWGNANYRSWVTLLLGALFIGSQIALNLNSADRSRENPRAQWTKILSATIPQNAILLSNDRDEMMPLWYIQYVEKTRLDLLGLFPLITPDPKYANIARLTDSVLDLGRPIYFIKPMPGIEVKYRLDASAVPLVRVLGRAADFGPQHASNAVLADRIRVLGYDLERVADSLRVRIYLQPQSKLDRNYIAYVQLGNSRGTKAAQGDDHQLGGNYYPTTLWQVGETLVDVQTIPLTDLPHDAYQLYMGMYTQPNLVQFGDAKIGVVEAP